MERPLTENIRPGAEPLDITQYEHAGGYQALRKAMQSMTPPEIIQEIKNSNLRGRGGAGFPTGQKWSFIPSGAEVPHPKYLIVNADEMEPATFKDRLLMEGNPHNLIEGMIIAAFAVQADEAYIFIRWAYKRAAGRLNKAIAEAYDRGYLGKDILSSGWGLNMHLHVSAGRYMCGEETGLLNSLEGKRANPRSKPPFPPVVGLWGNPTLVNNVETLCCVPHIITHGASWFESLSYTKDGGTKIYGVSGKVNHPGAWELPMGTTIREILEKHAGGMREGAGFRAVIPGGASTEFLLPEHLDVPMDYDAVRKAGSRMGTGTMLVLDDQTCPVGLLLNLEAFFAQESCGWCTPCWSGLHWVAQILQSIENGEGQRSDLDILEKHTRLLQLGHTFCALAPGAMEPLQSGLKFFREDFEQHIRLRRCPWHSNPHGLSA